MFGLIKIKLFGHQPIPKISDQMIEILIARDYKNNTEIVKTKLKKVNSDNQIGKNRINADIQNLVLAP